MFAGTVKTLHNLTRPTTSSRAYLRGSWAPRGVAACI